jgi:hypothetical protein
MRVRITRPRSEEIDGIRLSSLNVGQVYDLPSSLATYLVATKAAESVPDALVTNRSQPGKNRSALSK